MFCILTSLNGGGGASFAVVVLQDLSMCSSCSGRQMLSKREHFSLFPFFPFPPPPFALSPLLLLSTTYGMGYIYIYIYLPFGQLGSAGAPPHLLLTPTLVAFWGGGVWIDSLDWCSASTAQRQPKHWCGVCAVLATSAEHCALQVIGRVS